MAKVISVEEVVGLIKDGDTVMIGGFMGCGSPHKVIDALVKKGTKNLTVMCNDGAWPEFGVAKLIICPRINKSTVVTNYAVNTALI